MASKDKGWTEETNGAAANSDEWGTEVEAEAQIAFEQEGDGFIGVYAGMDEPTSSGIVQGHFEKVLDLNEQWLGDAMFLNLGRDLINKLKKIHPGAQVRIVWTRSMNTGQKTPMRVYSVQWR